MFSIILILKNVYILKNCFCTVQFSTIVKFQQDSLKLFLRRILRWFNIYKRVVQRKNWLTRCQNNVTGWDIVACGVKFQWDTIKLSSYPLLQAGTVLISRDNLTLRASVYHAQLFRAYQQVIKSYIHVPVDYGQDSETLCRKWK